jgi:uncharacterized protein YcbX
MPLARLRSVTFRVDSVRRYPVKSMGGESLDHVVFDRRGIRGDRWFAVEDEEGRFASGKNTRRFRRRDAVFNYRARTDETQSVLVSRDGAEWLVGDPELNTELSLALGSPVKVKPETAVPHQDMGSVSIIGTGTLDWCSREWGGDTGGRRLRTNITVQTQEPFIEETWIGRQLQVGSTRLVVVERVPRCRMIDIAQDGAQPSVLWLRPASRDRDMMLGIYADVVIPGEFEVGDRIQIGQHPSAN